MLTFVIPVRHPKNAKNWAQLKKLLSQTVNAIARQENKHWSAVVVVNDGSDLPPLPAGFEIEYVSFPPNPRYELGNNPAEREAVYDSVRFDKGRRILAGMLHARSSDYFMIVDDDDFVSRELAGFVHAHAGASGWYMKNGYVWSEGGRFLYVHPNFHKYCGTSHIVRKDLMNLPSSFEGASDEYIKTMLGSHVFIDDHLRRNGTPLEALPFLGAVYRIGHPGAHSKSNSLLRTFVLQREYVKKPWIMARNLMRIHPLTRRVKKEFFEA